MSSYEEQDAYSGALRKLGAKWVSDTTKGMSKIENQDESGASSHDENDKQPSQKRRKTNVVVASSIKRPKAKKKPIVMPPTHNGKPGKTRYGLVPKRKKKLFIAKDLQVLFKRL